MSFNINWDTICNDESLALSFREFLNSKLETVSLPQFLANLHVVDFKFGNTAPSITIRDIDIPFPEFYASEKTEEEKEQNEEEGKGDSEGEDGKRLRNKNGNLVNGKAADNTQEIPQSIPMGSRPISPFLNNNVGLDGSPTRTPSPSPFLNNTNSFLMPRTSSGFTPTLGHLGVGLGAFGIAGVNSLANVNQYEVNLNNGSSGSNFEDESEYFQPMQKDNTTDFNNILKGISGLRVDEEESHSYQNMMFMDEKESHSSDDLNFDIQLSIDFDWNSDLYIEITCDLLVNYPAPEFIRLPVRLKLTDLKIHSLIVVAYINKKVFVSFLCDIEDSPDNTTSNNNGNSELSEPREGSRRSPTPTRETFNGRNKGKDRIDILQDMKIEGEIGNLVDEINYNLPFNIHNNGLSPTDDGNGLVLRNIGKIEKFLIGTIRSLMIDEMAWPGWIELDFNEVVEEEEEEEEGPPNEGEEEDGDDKYDKEKQHEVVSEGILGSSEFGTNKGSETVGLTRPVSRTRRLSQRDSYRSSSQFDESSLYSSDSYFSSDDGL